MLKEVTVDLFISENIPDKDGDIFSMKELEKLHNKEIPVTQNFDNTKIIGKAKIIYKKGIGCGAVLTIEKDFNEKGLYPCFSFRGEDRINNEFLGIEAQSIGLCSNENSDENIKPL